MRSFDIFRNTLQPKKAFQKNYDQIAQSRALSVTNKPVVSNDSDRERAINACRLCKEIIINEPGNSADSLSRIAKMIKNLVILSQYETISIANAAFAAFEEIIELLIKRAKVKKDKAAAAIMKKLI